MTVRGIPLLDEEGLRAASTALEYVTTVEGALFSARRWIVKPSSSSAISLTLVASRVA